MADLDELEVQDSRPEIAASHQLEPLHTHDHTRLSMITEPGAYSGNEHTLATTLSRLDLDDTNSEVPEVQAGRSEIAASYQYEPLPTREHTRVLVLQPGPDNDKDYPLVGILKPIDLNDANLELFEAISYVWGRYKRSHVILVDGQPLRITASLRRALLQTRLSDHPRRLWADGICINQSDHAEKGHQVALMGRIYRTSQRTLICLGWRHAERAQLAAPLVDEVNLMIQSVQRDPNFSGEPGSFPHLADNETVATDSRWELGWNVLVKRQWFRRGWVVQEVSLPLDACVLWGNVQIDWTSIVRVYFWLYHRGYHAFRNLGLRPPLGLANHHYCAFARRRPEEAMLFDTSRKVEKRASTLTTLFETRWLKLSDPRDRIYAFMALNTSDGILADLQLVPDYMCPFEKIYHEFALKYTENSGDLAILSFIKHDKTSLGGPTQADGIPSWVPRWDLVRKLRRPVRGMPGIHPKAFTFTEQGSILRVRGLILGSVEYATHLPFWGSTHRDPALQIVTSLWSEIVAASGTDEGPYDGRQALAFLDALYPYFNSRAFKNRPAIREDFVRYLHSHTNMSESERFSAISISQSSELGTRQDSLEILAEQVLRVGPRQFVILSRGYYGTAPFITQKGDLFAVIYGSETLSILRPAGDKPGHYQIVGPTYIGSKFVGDPDVSIMGTNGLRDWEEWGLTEQDINLC